MDRIKDTADRILYECGLKRVLEKYGEVHIVGSYYIDAMAWNDLDVYVDNRTMTTEKLYALTSELLTAFNPSWYEASHHQDFAQSNEERLGIYFKEFTALEEFLKYKNGKV